MTNSRPILRSFVIVNPNAIETAPFRTFPIKDSGKPPFKDSSLSEKLSRVEWLYAGCPKTD
jgi:hypothetical protein